jgi:signal transduction histidine kinase
MRRAGLFLLGLAGAVIGVAAERQAYSWPDLRSWVPDLLAGWTLVGLGLALLALRRPPRAAALLLLAGFLWFAFNFANADGAAIRALATRSAYLHRGPLFALALALPTGRPRSTLAAGGAVLAWIAAIVWWLWDKDGTALALVGTFVAVASISRARSRGRRGRAASSHGLVAVVVLGVAIAADAIRSLAGGSQSVVDATVLGYALAVAVCGIVLFRAALLDEPVLLAERAIAFQRSGGRLRDALRELLGDPGLELGFGSGSERLVDDLGEPLAPPAPWKATTPVGDSGGQIGVVFHDPSALDDSATRDAVLASVRLAARRAKLRVELDRQIAAVEASRLRLSRAEDDERRRLANQVERGPGAELDRVEKLVQSARHEAAHDGELVDALDRASDQLERVRPELGALVHGLGGLEAEDLVAALERLAARLPVETRLELAHVSVPAEVGSALWFVCAESLTNVVKHARARSVHVVLRADDATVRLSVEDDGKGGADPSGSGLVGLAARAAAVGGRLSVVSPRDGGTRVVAELPRGKTS